MRRALIRCTQDIATLLRAGRALGVSVIDQRQSFEGNYFEVLVESADLPIVREGEPWPWAEVREAPDRYLRVVLL